jgi:hypothetical protein
MAEQKVERDGTIAWCVRTLRNGAERLSDWIDGLDGLSESERERLRAERERHAEEAALFPKSFPFLWH